MNTLQIFNNEEFGSIRTLTIDGEPWFVGKDVALALGYSKPRNAIASHVEDEDKKDALIQGPLGGTQTMTIINESGMYSLIFGSKLESAKRFKRWVTSEVLPALCKTGTYMMPGAEKSEQRDITIDDYIQAAKIVGSCKNERLPIVLNLIERAGISIPKVEPANSMTPHSEEIIEFVERPVPYNWDEWSLQQRRTYWSEEQYDEKYTLVPRRKICAAEVWCELFGGNMRDLTSGNNKSRDINKILSGMPLWERMKNVDRFGTAYGSQRGFRRCG